MAELSTHDKLKEIIAMAKKNPNFGLALGTSSTDQPVLLAHKTKATEVLEKAAKKEAGGNKTGCGTLDFSGGTLFLQFETDPPPGCLRVLKRHFKFNRIKVKLAIVSPCGTVEDELTYNNDDQASTDDAGGDAPSGRERSNADAPKPDPAMLAAVEKARKLTEIFDRTRPGLSDVASAEPAKAAVIDKLLRAFDKAAAASPPDVAAMEKLTTAAQQQLPKPGQRDPGQRETGAKLTDLFKKVAASAIPHAKTDPALAAVMRDKAAAFKAALAASPPDLSAAKAAIDALQSQIPKPGQASSDAPVRRAHSSWSNAFNLASSEMGKLEDAIKAAATGSEGIGKVDKAFGDLRNTLTQLDAALTKALSTGIGTGDAAQIGKARSDALKLADQVDKILVSHRILAKIDDNPFLRIRAVSGLRKSLSEMREDLKAAA
jgi:hypothetical protein